MYSWSSDSLWRISYPSYVGIWAFNDIDSYTTLSFLLNLFQSALTPQSHNSPVQHSTRHTGQDSAKVIKPHLSVGRVHKLQIYPISALMPGSHHYDSGCLTEPPVVTRSSSRIHYKWCNSLMILSLIMLFVSASHNFGCNRLQFSQQEQNYFLFYYFFSLYRKQLCNPYILWLIWQFISQLSNRNPNWNCFETVEWWKPFEFHFPFVNCSFFFLVTYYLPPWGWLQDLLTLHHQCKTYVIQLFKMCIRSIVLIALQILSQRNENRITLRSDLCYIHQLLSRSTSCLTQKGQIIWWMSGCCTP